MTDQPTADAIFRAQHVGASEVSALYGLNPYLTEFELWHRKVGNVATPEFNAIADDGTPDNERIYWGVRLEATIIEAAKERYGYTDREQLPHLTDGKGLGGHPDRRVICPQRGPGLLEIKCVDWLVRKGWGDEPPENYLIQSNTNQGLDGVAWGDFLVLVGGNKLERFQYDFRAKLYADCQRRTDAFWASVRAGKPPKADYSRDLDTIAGLNLHASDTLVDLRRDNRMPELMQEYLDAKAEETAAGCRVDAAKAEILEKLGENGEALVEGYSCRAPTVKGSADKTITADMIGQTIKGRAPHRRFYIKEKAL